MAFLDNREKLYAWGRGKFFTFKETFETEYMLTPFKLRVASKRRKAMESAQLTEKSAAMIEEMEDSYENICAQDTLSFIVFEFSIFCCQCNSFNYFNEKK